MDNVLQDMYVKQPHAVPILHQVLQLQQEEPPVLRLSTTRAGSTLYSAHRFRLIRFHYATSFFY